MNFLMRYINRNTTLSSSAVLIGSASVIGIVLGLIRTKLINANFNNFSSGAYFAAFKIPDLIFYTLTAGALTVAFIPVLSDKVFSPDKKQAWILTSYVLNALSGFMFLVCLTLVLFPRPILEYIIVPGFSPEQLDITAQIMRLAAINPLVFSVTSILSSVQQVFGRFFFFAVAPLFYNLSIIASIYLFKDSMGVVGLGVGVIAGALFNLLILGFGMNKLNFRHIWAINFKDKAFRRVLAALTERILRMNIIYLNLIVQIRIASSISIQAVTNLENALLLHHVPGNLLGTALGTAAFPRLTKDLSQGRPESFRADFLRVLRAAVWLVIPVVSVSYFCRDFLAKLIFARDVHEIALIFGWLCLTIFFRSVAGIIGRFFDAQKDNLTPLFTQLGIFVPNIGFSWWLANAHGVVGLGMASGIVAGIEITILAVAAHLKNKGLFNKAFRKALVAMGFISLAVFGVTFLASSWLPIEADDLNLDIFFKLSMISCFTFAAHLLISHFAKLQESQQFLNYVGNLFQKIFKVFNKLKIKR